MYQLNSSGHLSYTWRVFNDATMPYFGHQHLPYAILAIVVLVLFGLFPTVLLAVYPFRWFQKLLNLFPIRWYMLHTSFQGAYTDGTEPGTHDCRWFASLGFIARYLMMLIGVSTFNSTFPSCYNSSHNCDTDNSIGRISAIQAEYETPHSYHHHVYIFPCPESHRSLGD